jgi:hypothetical protein
VNTQPSKAGKMKRCMRVRRPGQNMKKSVSRYEQKQNARSKNKIWCVCDRVNFFPLDYRCILTGCCSLVVFAFQWLRILTILLFCVSFSILVDCLRIEVAAIVDHCAKNQAEAGFINLLGFLFSTFMILFAF